MNLRDVKKDIEYFIGEFIDDCSLFVMLNPGKDTEEVNNIISEAVDLYNDLKDKINNAPRAEKKKKEKITRKDRKNLAPYFDGIRREMLEKLDELSEKLSTTITSQAEGK